MEDFPFLPANENDAKKALAGDKPWSLDMCMERLRKVRQEAESTASLEPIHTYFKQMADWSAGYFRNGPRSKAAWAYANLARMTSLWNAHFDTWYMQFKKELEPNEPEPEDLSAEAAF